MKREVTRRRALPAFQLDIPDLGLLWSRCCGLFDAPDKVRGILTFEFRTETLEFSSLAELEEFQGLPDRITKLSLRLYHGDRRVSINSPLLFGAQCEVSAGGESEAWCAGAVESVFAFIANHRTAYSWFVAAPLGWILLLVTYGLPIATLMVRHFVAQESQVPPAVGYTWASVVGVLTLLYLSRRSLFPAAVLKVRETRGFVRRNVAELSLLVAVASLAIAILGWIFRK